MCADFGAHVIDILKHETLQMFAAAILKFMIASKYNINRHGHKLSINYFILDYFWCFCQQMCLDYKLKLLVHKIKDSFALTFFSTMNCDSATFLAERTRR